MSRPLEQLRRPEKISIRQGIVTCRYGTGDGWPCTYISGPYLTRDEACQAAIAHYERHHQR